MNIKFTSARILSVVLEALGSPILLCVLGNRIFFNLKEAVEHGINVGTNWSSYTHSAIRFDESETQSELMMYVDGLVCCEGFSHNSILFQVNYRRNQFCGRRCISTCYTASVIYYCNAYVDFLVARFVLFVYQDNARRKNSTQTNAIENSSRANTKR